MAGAGFEARCATPPYDALVAFGVTHENGQLRIEYVIAAVKCESRSHRIYSMSAPKHSLQKPIDDCRHASSNFVCIPGTYDEGREPA